MYAALAVAFVAIFVGVPIWWFSTTTYRAFLPYQEIHNLAVAKTNCLIPLTIVSCLTPKDEQDFEKFKAELTSSLQSGQGIRLKIQYTIDWQTCTTKEQSVLESSTSLTELDSSLNTARAVPHGHSVIYIVHQDYKHLSSANGFIGRGRITVAKIKGKSCFGFVSLFNLVVKPRIPRNASLIITLAKNPTERRQGILVLDLGGKPQRILPGKTQTT